jgi:D-serine deaminase-like pyridoxal phosphate-dependent protein
VGTSTRQLEFLSTHQAPYRASAASQPSKAGESTEDRAIVDAGLKALAFDSGPPLVCDEPAATYERASDEHSRLAVSAATTRLGLGDKIRQIHGHCDPTVNLYDWYVGIRGNRVEPFRQSPPEEPLSSAGPSSLWTLRAAAAGLQLMISKPAA